MNIKSHSEVRERIEDENRDIALIAAPGMGLTTFIKSLEIESKYQLVWIDMSTLLNYWDVKYKDLAQNRNHVIHGAAISALMKSSYMNLSDVSLTDAEIYKTDLLSFLNENGNNIIGENPLYLVIDNFEHLDLELALMVCNELKALADYKSKPRYASLKRIRFIIGGAIDFYSMYKIKASSKSPATQFGKTLPYQFLLSPQETSQLVLEYFPELAKSPHLVDLVADWSGGYIHYIFTFSKWISSEVKHLSSSSVQELVAQLKRCIQDNDKVPMYKYCNLNWGKIEDNDDLMATLRIALSTGYINDLSENSRKLAEYGFFVERPGVPGIFVLANTLVEFFIRERLAEKNLVLPLDESINFIIPSLNSRAHLLILQIETQLRNFIGDALFVKYNTDWTEKGIGVKSNKGKLIKNEAHKLLARDEKSIYAPRGLQETLLSYLEFSDLVVVVKRNAEAFDHEDSDFSHKLPEFITELTYYRNRMAHNRSFSLEQVETLASRWKIIQKLMLNVSKKKSK